MLSDGCLLCNGDGLAPIFNPTYTGSQIEYVFDADCNRKQMLMRSRAYCQCLPHGGEKLASIHRGSCPNEFLRIPDIHDVLANRYPDWQVNDPTVNMEEMPPQDELPLALRKLGAKLRIKPYRPQNDREFNDRRRREINDMFRDDAG